MSRGVVLLLLAAVSAGAARHFLSTSSSSLWLCGSACQAIAAFQPANPASCQMEFTSV